MTQTITRVPIRTIEALNQLDDEEIMLGYRSGKDGDSEPGGNHSLSYWHGWRNGRVDGGHAEKDQAQAELARAVIAEQNLARATLTKGITE